MRVYHHRLREAISDFCRHWVRSLIHWGLWWITFFVFSCSLWIHRKFGAPPFDQFLFHIQLGAQGLLASEYYVIKSFVVSCLLLPGIGALAIASGIVTAALQDVAAIHSLTKRLFFTTPIACLLAACLLFLNQISFFAYAENRTGQDYFAAHYQDPKNVALSEKAPRNLVLIYVESLDAGYGKASLFGKDLLHSVNASAVHGVSFDQYNQVPGTGWTIAGIVSTQCGVPLQPVSLYDGNVQGEKLKHFLPDAVCLGDVLDKFGYRNVFMGGFDLGFAGKGKFLRDHHYANRYGRQEWAAEGEKFKNMKGWGLRDDDLFRHAKTELDTLEASGGRFNLTLLTLDTHYPGPPSLSDYCQARGSKSFPDIVECTADQLGDFIGYIRQKGYLNNTDIVIIGDHLAMSNPVISRLKQIPDRSIFNLFIAKDLPRKNRETLVHFDLFPTILDFIGIHVQNARMGLGYSGFSQTNPRLDLHRLMDMRRDLPHPSPLYFALWKQPAETVTPPDTKSTRYL